jgi:hypothetical protein
MSDAVTVASVQGYKDNVEFLLQQKDSRLQDAVSMRGDYVGKNIKFVEQYGQVDMRAKTTRHADVVPVATPQDARWIAPQDWELPEYVDQVDKLRMLHDPTNYYAQNFKHAANRRKDDSIINAFFATAQTGENGTTPITWAAFIAANPGHSIPAGGVGMTLAKIRAGVLALRLAEVDEDDPLFLALGANEHDDLFNEIQVVSTDYNWGPDGQPILREGRIQRLFGVNLLQTQRLLLTGAERRCPLWAKSGMHLGLWKDVYTSVDKIPTKGMTWQVYTCATFNATRTQEKKVVEILAA